MSTGDSGEAIEKNHLVYINMGGASPNFWVAHGRKAEKDETRGTCAPKLLSTDHLEEPSSALQLFLLPI